MGTRIIVASNQKGGVGKTSTVQILAAGLATRGKKILAIDLDQQCNLTSCYLDPSLVPASSYDMLLNKKEAKHCICKVSERIDIIPASNMLSAIEIDLGNKAGNQVRLAKALKEIKNRYDFILIDTPPALGLASINAYTAADEVIIPCQADLFSIQGLDMLSDTIAAVKEYCNPRLRIGGILLVRHNNRTVLGREIKSLLYKISERLETKIYNAAISECIAVKEAQINRTDVISYKPYSTAALDYKAFADEVLADGEEL